MRKILFALMAGVLALPAQAQPERYQSLAIGSKVIGKTISDGRDIVARTYVSGWNIFDTYVDSVTNTVIVMNRESNRKGHWAGMGNVIACSMNDDNVKWSLALDYKHTQLIQLDNLLVRSWNISNRSYGTDLVSGSTLWENDILFYYIDTLSRTGVGYRFGSFIDNTSKNLYGVDLTTGNILWEREINRFSGWSAVTKADDSTIIIASGGLHSVDLRTGKGWSHTLTTGINNYAGSVIERLSTVLVKDFATNFRTGTPRNFTRDLISNILVDNGMTYFAGQDKVICVDNASGAIIWEYEFALNSVAGNSEIFIIDGKLLVISKGYGLRGDTKVNYGLSFFVGFDKSNGNVLFRNELGSTKGVLDKIKAEGNFLYILTGSTVSKYSIADGSLVAENKVINAGGLMDFAQNGYYEKTGAGYSPVAMGAIAIYSTQEGLVVLDDKLDIKHTLEPLDAYKHIASYNKFKLLRNAAEDAIIVLDEVLVAELKISERAIIKDRMLYDIQGNTLVRADVSQMVGF